jgi:conjugative transfer pilus assembly protein TraH
MPNNYTWAALGKKYGGFDTQFREFLMTLVGTVIYDPAGTGGKPRVQFIGPADSGADQRHARRDVFDPAQGLGAAAADTAKCMNP